VGSAPGLNQPGRRIAKPGFFAYSFLVQEATLGTALQRNLHCLAQSIAIQSIVAYVNNIAAEIFIKKS
jgi:hypothetical protein